MNILLILLGVYLLGVVITVRKNYSKGSCMNALSLLAGLCWPYLVSEWIADRVKSLFRARK